MKCLCATLLASTVLLFPDSRAVAFQDSTQTNVNSRYKIERISVQSSAFAVTKSIQREFDRLIGRPFRTEVLDELEKRIRAEIPNVKVTRKVLKGQQKDQIAVQFVLERSGKSVDFNTTRLAYHSQQNFSFGAGIDFKVKRVNFSGGLLTDNNERVERYSGLRAGFLTPLTKDSRVRLAFIAESFRSQWHTQSPDFQRTRTNFEPTVLIDILPGLKIRSGFTFNNLEFQLPAARVQAANAVTSTLRYSKQWQLGLAGTQTLDAGYNLRAAATLLSSDFEYRRHTGEARLTFASGNSEKSRSALTLSTLFGAIGGQAPVFDRFVLGNFNTLRGYNRFEIAPFGGDRVIHFSADGRYRFVRAVYDTGTISNSGRPKVLRHSAGLGFVVSGITAMVAFPIRGSSIEPVFLLGMNF
ncbi:MAG: hypothetical protein FJW36_26335 [Acidobacteria bacterium]|nr:hypothetical protein [Acidobacteriota bacterium]